MAWIEFHAARIKRLQKFHDFRSEMGWSVNEALGFLGNLWGEVIELREDGDITGLRPEYVAELCSVNPRSVRKLWATLVAQGWIETVEGRELLHDWLDCAGRYLEKRYYTADPGRLVEIWKKHGETYVLNETQQKITARRGSKQMIPRLSKDDPPTSPDLTHPTHLPATNGERQVDSSPNPEVKSIADGLRRRGRLLELCEHRMPFGKEDRGKLIANMDPERCRWYLTEFAGRGNLDPITRAALEARVELKAMEARH